LRVPPRFQPRLQRRRRSNVRAESPCDHDDGGTGGQIGSNRLRHIDRRAAIHRLFDPFGQAAVDRQ
jgi:hypothetical protein